MRGVRRPSRTRRAGSAHWLAAVGALTVGLAALLLIRAPEGRLAWQPVLAAALVGLGAEAAIWLRPTRAGSGRLNGSAWVLPGLLVLAALLLLETPPFDPGAYRVAAAVASGAVLGLVLLLQDQESARGLDATAVVRFGE